MERTVLPAALAQALQAAARSFVVQLCDPADPTPAQAIGRVENVASGEVAYFYTMQELGEFMRRTAGAGG
ncbi:hypothetical protein [Solimonas sp. SE-A11]|uniref:hypothetical protein n=1 Tax=Solimonas sp. SE-A11 TaxID=3054954 RepID=UPI00259C9022|nr:hypothetical protein [Solimonas sp. SE-A11]MDM4772607.1 hypothetical protein [Solimonas sp. SE-A11]